MHCTPHGTPHRTPHHTSYRLLLLLSLATLAGCESRDPYMRTDVWRPTGANAGNIAAMVANPRDLIQGHGVAREDTKAAALAVDHVWTNQPMPLLQLQSGSSSSSSSSGSSGSGSGSGSGGSSGSGGT
jgi:type IV pilus biogenesis protein CpaD/CtpE